MRNLINTEADTLNMDVFAADLSSYLRSGKGEH